MTYDVLGRRTALTTPETGTTTTRYNGFGEVREETDAEGRTTVFVTDSLGRVVEQRTQEAGVPTVATFTFDSAPNGIGALAGATRGSPDAVTTALAYEPVFGGLRASDLHVPASTGTERFSTEQTYDRFGRIDAITYPPIGGRDADKTRGLRACLDEAA
jgi:YD repeat-containing protein